MTLIDENQVFLLGAIMLGLASVGFLVDNHPIGRKTSGVIWVLVGAMLLSNTGVVPFESPVYGFIGDRLVPVAIPLMLYKADLRRIFRESGRVMMVFLIASAATIIGAITGYIVLNLGEIGPKVAGVYTGAYIGGAVNLLAVAEAVQMTETEFSGTISASSMVSILALMMLVAIPSVGWILRKIPSKIIDASHYHEKEKSKKENTRFIPTHIAIALGLSFTICAGAEIIGNLLGTSRYNILIVTLITLVIGNVIPRMLYKIEGEFELGMLFMYIFFAAVGAGTDAFQFMRTAMLLFAYGMIIILVHIGLVLTMARLFKIDLAEAVVASGAALVGPSVTAAIAISRGWRSLVTPAIMCGIFGYAIATFLGYGLSKLLSHGAL